MVPNLRAAFLNPPDIATTHYHSEFDAQWQEELGQKAQTEEEKRQEMVIAAKGAMDEWGAQREVQRESKTSQNRQDEQLLCEQIELEREADPWDRVVKLVDLQTDASDDLLDTSRMRAIFIRYDQHVRSLRFRVYCNHSLPYVDVRSACPPPISMKNKN